MQILRTSRRACAALVFASTLACFAAPAAAQVTWWSASLDGAQEVPPVPTTARGWAVVRLEEPANTVRVFVFHEGLVAVTASHLHVGPAGSNGGIIVGLAPGAVPNTFTGSGGLSAANVTALKNAGTYVNVHTAAFGGGEIRGQVVQPTSTRFTAVLNGASEVPPNPSAATGTFVGFLHRPDNRLVYVVQSSGFTTAVTAAHLHSGAPTVNGPIVVPLTGANGNYCGVSPQLTAAQVTALSAGGWYANVHTAAFGGGEIRGQLAADAGDHFVAPMDGLQEVPPNPSPGIGQATLTLGPGNSATVTVSYAGLTGPVIAAHIHAGAIGVNGPIEVPLAAAGVGAVAATFTPTTSQVAALRAGNWYVNLHTAAFGGGEIRGQLGAARLPTTFGAGCPVSTGTRPETGATGFPSLGSAFTIDLYGVPPGAFAASALSFNRDTGGPAAVPLPASFTLVGIPAPACFFLVDPVSTTGTLSNAFGCASLPLGVPLVPAFRGIELFGQWFVFDPGAPGGLAASNGLSMLVQ